jgi:hypothetical protein
VINFILNDLLRFQPMNELLLLIIDQKERIRRQDSSDRRVCNLQPVNQGTHKSHDLYEPEYNIC